jgi:hypothetical protein
LAVFGRKSLVAIFQFPFWRAGRGKLRWVNIECRHCGHGTVAELVRKHNLERRLPGVTMCRNGDVAVISFSAANSSFSNGSAAPRRSTAPCAIVSFDGRK